jgi:hypothetical protein
MPLCAPRFDRSGASPGKRGMVAGGWLLAPALFAFVASACSSVPVTVDDCRVARDVRGVVASALVTNHSAKGSERVEVVFATSGLKKTGGVVGYAFTAHLEPGEARVLTVRTPIPPLETEDQVLGTVNRCTLRDVTYEDGTQWDAPEQN